MDFRTIRVGVAGWALIVLAGAILGLGIGRVGDWPFYWSIPTGIVLLWGALWLLDRRSFRKATTIIRVERSVAELEKLAARIGQRGLNVGVSREPRGIACSGRVHAKVVAAIEEDATRKRGTVR